MKAVVTSTMASASTTHGTTAGSFDGDSMMTDNLTPAHIPPIVDVLSLGKDTAMAESLMVAVLVPPQEPTQNKDTTQQQEPLPAAIVTEKQ